MVTAATEVLLHDSIFSPAVNDSDLTIALKQVRARAFRYKIFEDYYRGKHDLAFATDKFKNAFGDLFRKFALNMCPAVCDAVSDNLQITGFGVEKGPAKLGKDAWSIWQANRMDQRAGEVHKEVVKSGDAYVIVWPDADGNPVIYPQCAAICTVYYDTEQPGKILWGAKFWRAADMRIRANVYYANRIEKFVTLSANPNGLPEKGTSFKRFQVDGEAWPLKNEYGSVPVFHFANNADVGQPGSSELLPVVPLQDALNKSVLDMMVAMEFVAFPQRWATGIEVEFDKDGKPIPPFVPGVERIWTADSSDAKFGEFGLADLSNFLAVKKDFKFDIALVSATPLHYFHLQDSAIPSGKALETLERRHVKKVKDRMTTFGNVWEDVMTFALQIGSGRNLRLTTQWEDPFAPTEDEKLGTLTLKKGIGIPEEQLWSEAGYAEEDITKMQEMNATKRQAALQDFNAGIGN
jgi:Phage portal protein, SPP1 Gp6-like